MANFIDAQTKNGQNHKRGLLTFYHDFEANRMPEY
jgi:hypothetical protein